MAKKKKSFDLYDVVVHKGMKVNEVKKNLPKHGETRVVKKYLWTPKTLTVNPDSKTPDTQLRWLEDATWLQQWFANKWIDLYWID